MFRAYLAGPEVFLRDARSVTDAKVKICAAYGFVGISPLDNVDLGSRERQAAGFVISEANEKAIRSCELLIANLTPFRGPSADVGTAYEVGFARGLGLPVFAYSNVADGFLERTREYLGDRVQKRQSGQLEDSYGMAIEDFGLADNLMLDGAIHASGSKIVVKSTPPASRFSDLAGFEKCVQLAARHFEGNRRWRSQTPRPASPFASQE